MTIPEGLSRDQIASDVLPEGVSSDDYLELTETAPKSFDTEQYGAKSRQPRGLPVPRHLRPPAEDNVQSLVDQQLAAFNDNIAQVDLKAARRRRT